MDILNVFAELPAFFDRLYGSLITFEQFLFQYRIPYFLLCLIAGYLYCFFGFQIIMLTLFLVGAGIGAAAAAILTDGGVIGLLIGGALGGVIFVAVHKISIFFLGAMFGLAAAGALQVGGGVGGGTYTLIFSALCGGVLMVFFERVLLSIATAISGASAMTYAISALALGASKTIVTTILGWIDKMRTVIENQAIGVFDVVTPIDIGFGVLFVLLSIWGSLYQISGWPSLFGAGAVAKQTKPASR